MCSSHSLAPLAGKPAHLHESNTHVESPLEVVLLAILTSWRSLPPRCRIDIYSSNLSYHNGAPVKVAICQMAWVSIVELVLQQTGPPPSQIITATKGESTTRFEVDELPGGACWQSKVRF
jgi:hypothetical protein